MSGRLAEDRDCAVLALEPLTPAGERHDHVGGGPSPVCGRRLLVELALLPEVLHEPAAGRVEVEEPELSRAVVVEAVHDARRYEHERPRRHADRLELGPDPQRHPARQDEEPVDVVEVDVRLGAALPFRVPGPRDVQPVVVAEDPQLALGPVHDRLALGRREQQRLHSGGLVVVLGDQRRCDRGIERPVADRRRNVPEVLLEAAGRDESEKARGPVRRVRELVDRPGRDRRQRPGLALRSRRSRFRTPTRPRARRRRRRSRGGGGAAGRGSPAAPCSRPRRTSRPWRRSRPGS